MICLCDTDILLKLVAFGLLDDALEALGILDWKMVYVTPEVASKCLRSRREHTGFRQETLNKVLAALKRFTVISEPGDASEFDLLCDVAMDAGETTLFMATRNEADFLLLTGDKRALRALTNSFLGQELHNRHLNRVVCLESIILLLIEKRGYAALQARLFTDRQCDAAIQNALQDGHASEAQVIESLERYVSDLQYETQGLIRKF